MLILSHPWHLARLGQEHKYHHILKGYNYRMEAMQGAILRVKLRHLEAWTESRRATRRGMTNFSVILKSNRQKLCPTTACLSHLRSARCSARYSTAHVAESGNPNRHPLSIPVHCRSLCGLCICQPIYPARSRLLMSAFVADVSGTLCFPNRRSLCGSARAVMLDNRRAKRSFRLSLVTPAYNETDNLPLLYARISAVLNTWI